MTDDRPLYSQESGYAPDTVFPDIFPSTFDEELDAFLDRAVEVAGETWRRTIPPGRVPRASARDSRKPTGPPKLELVLYTSAASEKSQRAMRAIRDVLSHYDASQVRLKTCDLASRPEDAEDDQVVFTPMLVKHGPGPRTAIIGNLEDGAALRELLDTSGITRRRWDD